MLYILGMNNNYPFYEVEPLKLGLVFIHSCLPGSDKVTSGNACAIQTGSKRNILTCRPLDVCRRLVSRYLFEIIITFMFGQLTVGELVLPDRSSLHNHNQNAMDIKNHSDFGRYFARAAVIRVGFHPQQVVPYPMDPHRTVHVRPSVLALGLHIANK